MAWYTIVDLGTGFLHNLHPAGWGSERDLKYAAWTKFGNGLVYVFDNNVYYRPVPIEESDIKLTYGGHAIIHGVPDWIYEGDSHNESILLVHTVIYHFILANYRGNSRIGICCVVVGKWPTHGFCYV